MPGRPCNDRDNQSPAELQTVDSYNCRDDGLYQHPNRESETEDYEQCHIQRPHEMIQRVCARIVFLQGFVIFDSETEMDGVAVLGRPAVEVEVLSIGADRSWSASERLLSPIAYCT